MRIPHCRKIIGENIVGVITDIGGVVSRVASRVVVPLATRVPEIDSGLTLPFSAPLFSSQLSSIGSERTDRGGCYGEGR